MNTGSQAVPLAPDSPRATVTPSFLGALQGTWSLTWKTQFSLRRLPRLLAALLIIPLLAAFTVPEGAAKPYFLWSVDFYFMLLLPLYCLSVCGAMIRDEIQADTLRFLVTRPVTRLQFFVIKYFCHAVLLESLALTSGLLLLAVGVFRHIPGIGTFALCFLGTQFLAVAAYGALSSLLGMTSQRYMVLGVIYGFVVEMGIGRIPTNINNLSISRHLRALLGNNTTIRNLYDWSPDGTTLSITLLLVATAVFLSLAALLFANREYHANEEMQK